MMSDMVDQNRSDVALLYRRAGFGLRPDELERAAAQGYAACVEQLTAGLGAATRRGVPPPTFSAGPTPASHDPATNRAHGAAVARDTAALQAWWIDRMISTSAPLQEKLALYWHGHFATGVSKVRDAKLMYLQNQLFRTLGGGGFEALTQAVAKDGAMMLWLDTSTDKAAHPNENFARETMELFTLGIGNYTQADVTAGARGFTGWVYDRRNYRYEFRANQHDHATKTYLGQTGDWNGTDIVHIAVTRPESARFVLARLWSHFAYPVGPADPVVGDLLASYGEGLSIGSALKAVFLHPAFLSPESRAGLVKQPVEWLAGAARALGLDAALSSIATAQPPTSQSASARTSPARKATVAALASVLGQTLFNPPNVGGWGQNGYWLDTATAQLRFDAALMLAGRADLTALAGQPAANQVASAASILGLDGWGPTSAGALSAMAGRPLELMALALSSPEYVLA